MLTVQIDVHELLEGELGGWRLSELHEAPAQGALVHLHHLTNTTVRHLIAIPPCAKVRFPRLCVPATVTLVNISKSILNKDPVPSFHFKMETDPIQKRIQTER